MERLELEVTKRDITGKKVRFLRRQGVTPAKVFGHGIASVPVQVDAKQMKQVLARAGQTGLISLKIADGGEPVRVLVREVQRNPLNEELLHVDFYQVRMTEKIKAEVPLVFAGEAPALKNKNTSLLRLMDSITIEALPDALPHSLEVDLSQLVETDQALHVKDIRLSPGVTLLTDLEHMVVKVAEARKEEVVEAVAAAAKAEVEGGAAEGEAPAEGAEEKQ